MSNIKMQWGKVHPSSNKDYNSSVSGFFFKRLHCKECEILFEGELGRGENGSVVCQIKSEIFLRDHGRKKCLSARSTGNVHTCKRPIDKKYMETNALRQHVLPSTDFSRARVLGGTKGGTFKEAVMRQNSKKCPQAPIKMLQS